MTSTHIPTALLLVLLTVACSPGADLSHEWTQFRGPSGVGLIAADGLPTSWTRESDNLRWRTEIPGEGNSSPIASRGIVFVTTATAKERRVERRVISIDGTSGAIRWQTVVAEDPREDRHRLNTFAAPTPATDGRKVYAFFGETLAALDFEGEIVWKRQVDPHYQELSHYGAASSVTLTERAVVVARDREDAKKGSGWLGAFDRETGEELWRRTWVDTCCSYATPLILERGGAQEVLFTHAGRITSYHPDTGETLWNQPLRQNQPVTSPAIDGDILAVFTGADHVRNGAVLQLTGAGAETGVEVLWQTRKMIPQVSSPVLYQGLLYTVGDTGALVCYDPATGKIVYRARLNGAGFRPSLLAGDGKIYAVDSYSRTSVFAAGREFELLAENDLEEPGNATPGFGAGCLLVRSSTSLFCIERESVTS